MDKIYRQLKRANLFPLLDRKETLFFEKINKFHVDNIYLESVRNYNLCNVGVFQMDIGVIHDIS